MLLGPTLLLVFHGGFTKLDCMGHGNTFIRLNPVGKIKQEIGYSTSQREIRVPVQRLQTPILLLGNPHHVPKDCPNFHWSLPYPIRSHYLSNFYHSHHFKGSCRLLAFNHFRIYQRLQRTFPDIGSQQIGDSFTSNINDNCLLWSLLHCGSGDCRP